MSHTKDNARRIRKPRRAKAPGPILPLFERPPEIADALRDEGMSTVAVNAQEQKPRFHQQAVDFVLWFLDRFGPAPAEHITDACKLAGIQPHDDRAFGPVYMTLAKRDRIMKVGSVRRERGHGTSGGNVWALNPEPTNYPHNTTGPAVPKYAGKGA